MKQKFYTYSCVVCFILTVTGIASHLMKKYFGLFLLVPAPIIFLATFGALVLGFLVYQSDVDKKLYLNGKIPGDLDSSELIINLNRKIFYKN